MPTKYFRILFFIIVCFLLLGSCNDDVFVDKLNASDTELQMSGEGDSAVVNFTSSDWSVLSVDSAAQPSSSLFYGILYDSDGHAISDYDVPFYQNAASRGKMVYVGRKNGFTVSRMEDKSVTIYTDENLAGTDFKFTVWIGNRYTTIPVHVTQSVSKGYSFDHITYDYISNSCKKELVGSFDSINVNSDTSITMECSVFSGESRFVSFVSDNRKAFSYTVNSLSVDIPVGVVDSALQYTNEKMYYKMYGQRGHLPFNDVTKTLVLPVGKSEIKKILEYEMFDADYTLFVRRNATGELKSVKGKFHSRVPTGVYYLLLNGKMQ
jgi:hypothetical protein